jgi:hypothetical protein
MFGAALGNRHADLLSFTPGGTQRTDAFSTVVVAVGTFGRDGQAGSLVLAEGKSGLEGQTLAASVPSSATLRNLDASPAVGAPSFASRANTGSAIIVIVWAFFWNENAVVENGTETVLRLVGQTLSAVVMSGTANWDLNALLGDRAETKTISAEFLALATVSRNLVSLHAAAAFVGRMALVRGFVLVAEINLREASLLVIGNEVSWLTQVANSVNEVNGATVENGRDTNKFVTCDEEAVGASFALMGFGTERWKFVLSAFQNLW